MGSNILHYKEQTGEIELHLGQDKEVMYTRVNSCSNPFCDCGEMDLFLFKEEDRKCIESWSKYEIGLNKRLLEINFNFKMSNELIKEANEIKDELEKKLTVDDWELLRGFYRLDKEIQVEENIEKDNEYLDFYEFDYIHMNDPSLLISFNEIYPSGEIYKIEKEGNLYEIIGYYCKNSECECTKVKLKLIEINGETKESFTYDYETKETENNKYVWVIEKLRVDYEDIELKMKLRSSRIKLLYNRKIIQMLQDKVETIKATIGKFEKIGRNDKCLCGTGKKYKKCCM